MQLKQLSIIHYSWQTPPRYEGSITFTDDTREIKLVLDQDLSQKVLALCADQIVESAKHLASSLTRASIMPALEGQQ